MRERRQPLDLSPPQVCGAEAKLSGGVAGRVVKQHIVVAARAAVGLKVGQSEERDVANH